MKPRVPLQYCSIAFAVMWGGWMFWSSDSHSIASLAVWAVGGAIAGYLWYLGMRWWFQRIKLLPRDGADNGAKPSAP
jgi:hypothetical protein